MSDEEILESVKNEETETVETPVEQTNTEVVPEEKTPVQPVAEPPAEKMYSFPHTEYTPLPLTTKESSHSVW